LSQDTAAGLCIYRLLLPLAVAGSALVALMQHMQKLPARSDCRNNLFVLSSSLAACVGNPKMQRVLQVGRYSTAVVLTATGNIMCSLRTACWRPA
jgi:hypothetical protein